jgi:hypothetical protein
MFPQYEEALKIAKTEVEHVVLDEVRIFKNCKPWSTKEEIQSFFERKANAYNVFWNK